MPYMYILECADGSYYTGSTWSLQKRLEQHNAGEGAKFTSKRIPVTLMYYEHFDSIKAAYQREKQVQGWSREKKKALIDRNHDSIHELSECKNDSHFRNKPDT